MRQEENRYTLKFFSGPHLGAEILFGNGNYVIGADEECDIVLSDESIAPRHLTLSIADGRINISAMEGVVYLDGEKIGDGDRALSFYQVVTIGTTHFALGFAGENWPALALPDIKSEERPEEEPQEKPRAEAAKIAVAVPAPEGIEKWKALFLAALKGGENWKALFFAGCGLLLLAFILLFLLISGPSDGPQTVPDRAQEIRDIRAVVKRMGIPGLKVVTSTDARPTIEGYVDKWEQKRELIQALKQADVEPLVRVKVATELVKSAKETVQAMGLELNVQWKGDGKISLQGFVRKGDLLEKVCDMLKQDIPGIREIDRQVLTQDSIIPDLFKLLQRFGLEGKIQFEVHPGYILAKGRLDQAEVSKWDSVKKTFFSKYGSHLPLKEDLKTAAGKATNTNPKENFHQPQSFVLPIRGISMGAVRYIIMEDGSKYFEGAMLKNGYVIESIKDNKVVLVWDGYRINYYIGGD
jgi:type III secretion protein D